MSETIIVGLLAFLGTALTCWITHNRTVAIVELRLDNLEKRVDKHNNLVERMYIVEGEIRNLRETK